MVAALRRRSTVGQTYRAAGCLRNGAFVRLACAKRQIRPSLAQNLRLSLVNPVMRGHQHSSNNKSKEMG
jgi:hypothetical protein